MATNVLVYKVEIDNKASVKTIQELIDRNKILRKQLLNTADKGTAEFKKLEKEFQKNNQEIQKFNRTLRQSGTLAQGVAKGMISAFKQVGVVLIAAFSARAIFNALSQSLEIFKQFEQAMADVRAVTLATNEEFEKLSAQAIALGGTTVFTATQIALLQKELGKLGFTIDEITAATPAILNLAAATGEDLAASAKIAGSTVRAFGLNAAETGRVVDVMALSFARSALDLDKFTVAMAKVAPVARNAGLNIERTTALLAQLVDRGVEATTAGTGLRNIFLELSKQGITFNEAMEKINNASDKNAVSLELFGKRGAVVGTILSETRESTEALTIELNRAGGTAKRMAEIQLDTLTGSITLLKSAWDGFVLSVIEGDGVLANTIRLFVDLTSGVLRLLSSVEASTETQAELLEITIQENNEISELIDRYDEVSGKVEQTTEDKEELEQITARLILRLGDSVGAINAETGALELNREAALRNLRQRLALQDEEVQQALLRRTTLEIQRIDLEGLIKLQERVVESNKAVAETGDVEIRVGVDIPISEINRRIKLQDEFIGQEFDLAETQEKRADVIKEIAQLDKVLIKNGIDLNSVLKTQNKEFDPSSPTKYKNAINALNKSIEILASRLKNFGLKELNDRLNSETELLEIRQKFELKNEKLTQEQRNLIIKRHGLERDLLEAKFAAEKVKIQVKINADISKLESDLTQRTSFELITRQNAALVALKDKNEKELAAFKGTRDQRLQLLEKFELEESKIIAKFNLEKTKVQQKLDKRFFKSIKDLAKKRGEDTEEIERQQLIQKQNNELEIFKGTEEQKTQLLEIQLTERESLEEKFRKKRKDKAFATANDISNLLTEFSNLQDAIRDKEIAKIENDRDRRIKAIEDERDAKIISEEEFQKKKAEFEASFEKQSDDINTRITKRIQILALAQTVINGAVATIRAFSDLGPIAGAIAAIGVATAIAAQLTTIESAKFAKGGILDGPSHSNKGIKLVDGRTGKVIGEAEGREPILTKSVSSDRKSLAVVSAINQMHGGNRLGSSSIPSSLMNEISSYVGLRNSHLARIPSTNFFQGGGLTPVPTGRFPNESELVNTIKILINKVNRQQSVLVVEDLTNVQNRLAILEDNSSDT